MRRAGPLSMLALCCACDSPFFAAPPAADAGSPSDAELADAPPADRDAGLPDRGPSDGGAGCVSFAFAGVLGIEPEAARISTLVPLPAGGALVTTQEGSAYRVDPSGNPLLDLELSEVLQPETGRYYVSFDAYLDPSGGLWLTVGPPDEPEQQVDAGTPESGPFQGVLRVELGAATASTSTRTPYQVRHLSGSGPGEPLELFTASRFETERGVVLRAGGGPWSAVLDRAEPRVIYGALLRAGPDEAYAALYPDEIIRLAGGAPTVETASGAVSALAQLGSRLLAGTEAGQILERRGPGEWGAIDGHPTPALSATGPLAIRAIAPFDSGFVAFSFGYLVQYVEGAGFCPPQRMGAPLVDLFEVAAVPGGFLAAGQGVDRPPTPSLVRVLRP